MGHPFPAIYAKTLHRQEAALVEYVDVLGKLLATGPRTKNDQLTALRDTEQSLLSAIVARQRVIRAQERDLPDGVPRAMAGVRNNIEEGFAVARRLLPVVKAHLESVQQRRVKPRRAPGIRRSYSESRPNLIDLGA